MLKDYELWISKDVPLRLGLCGLTYSIHKSVEADIQLHFF